MRTEDVPGRIGALRSKVRGTQALPGKGHSLSVRKTDTPVDLRSMVWWGLGVPCGGQVTVHAGRGGFTQEVLQSRVGEQRMEALSVGVRVDG